MATLTTQNIKPINELANVIVTGKTEPDVEDLYIMYEASTGKNKKLRHGDLGAAFLNAKTAAINAKNNAEEYAGDAETAKGLAEAAQGASETAALKSEGFAVGKQNGTEVVDPQSPYYHNNAKHYSDNSDLSAEKAEGFAVGQKDGSDVPSTSPYYENNAKHYNDESRLEALKSEGFAIGKQDGSAVPSTSPYYQNNAAHHSLKSEGFAVGKQNGVEQQSGPYFHNNAKYWADQAHQATLYTPPIAMSSAAITDAPALSANLALTFFFTANIAGNDGSTPLTISYNGVSVPVKAHKNGSLVDVTAKEISTGNYRYLDAYTTLQVIYDGTNFVVVGNPVVLSGATYTIYADGYDVVDSVSDNNMRAVTSNAVFDALQTKVEIITASNVDLNTLKAIGVYKCSSSTGPAHHYPTNTAGTMSVFTNDGVNVTQVYYANNSTDIYTRNYTAGSWSNWTNEKDLNDWEPLTITMESGYVNEIGAPEVYWSPSRKQIYISKLDAHPTSGNWVGGTPFCHFTRPSGFDYNAWGLVFYASVFWSSGGFYPISCNVWVNPNDRNDLGLTLLSIDLVPGNYSIGSLYVRILGTTLQGKPQ